MVVNTKTLVVGLDGVSDSFWDIPQANKLINHHGKLETYYSTFPSFMCSLTGKEIDTSLQEEFTTHRIGYDMLWDYFSSIKQGDVNVPCIYPAENINGFMICGWRAEGLNSQAVRPIELVEKLKDMGYYWGLDRFESMSVEGRWDDFLDEALNQIDMHTKSTIRLASKHQPELLFMVYVVTDQCLHQRRETRLGEERIDKLKSHLASKLNTLDRELKPETLLFFSDHGVNEEGYHGTDHPTTKWGTWALRSGLRFVPPRERAHILDIFPTILSSLNVDIPNVEGYSLLDSESSARSFEKRMRELGYL